MEDGSNYLIIDKLKKTFVKHWSRLCELQARNPTTGRPVDKKFKCTGKLHNFIQILENLMCMKFSVFSKNIDTMIIIRLCIFLIKQWKAIPLIAVVQKQSIQR